MLHSWKRDFSLQSRPPLVKGDQSMHMPNIILRFIAVSHVEIYSKPKSIVKVQSNEFSDFAYK